MRPQLTFSCPEKWDAMSPQSSGRYCNSCEKVVTDFSQMSNEEILQRMHSSNEAGACGSFKAYQLEKPFHDKRNALIDLYRRISSGKTALPKFISLGLVTVLLLLSGCHRRLSGAYHTPTRREMKEMQKREYKMQQAGQKKLEKDRKTRESLKRRELRKTW